MDVLGPVEKVRDPLQPYAAVERVAPDGRCWVMANMVGGLDGSASVAGRVGALSTPADAELFSAMRALADVVLVGAETVRREGYAGFAPGEQRVAARVAAGRRPVPRLAIVTRSLDLDWTSGPFVPHPGHERPLVLTCRAADPHRVAAAAAVAEVVPAGEERVDPHTALRALADRGHRVVLCEGGPTWLGQLIDENLLDELCLTISPIMGGDALPVSVSAPDHPVRSFALRQVLAEGNTLFLRYERGHDDH